MKRYLLFYVLLITCVLCSCTNIFSEPKNSEEPDINKFLPVQSSTPTTGPADAKPSTTPNEHPPAYQGAPVEYSLVLDDFHLFSEHFSGEEFLDGDLEKIGFTEYPYSQDEKLAYAVIDINSDGVPELLLGTEYGLKNSAPNSIFTLKDGKPVLLTSFWSRSSGVISADGTIYSVGSGGAAYTYLSSFRLDEKADTLTQLTDIYSDYSDSDEKPFYVQVVDGEDHYISEETFWDFFEKYDNPPEIMELTVIPIANYCCQGSFAP